MQFLASREKMLRAIKGNHSSFYLFVQSPANFLKYSHQFIFSISKYLTKAGVFSPTQFFFSPTLLLLLVSTMKPHSQQPLALICDAVYLCEAEGTGRVQGSVWSPAAAYTAPASLEATSVSVQLHTLASFTKKSKGKR